MGVFRLGFSLFVQPYLVRYAGRTKPLAASKTSSYF
jgi:hypothetical protein